MLYEVKKEFDAENNIILLSGALASLHCHHYNCGLLRAMEEIKAFDGQELFRKIAEEQFYYKYKQYLIEHPDLKADREKLIAASEMYSIFGFGKIDLSTLSFQGGVVVSSSSYFVTSWFAKYGRRKTPVCHFTRGFLAGILDSVYDKPLGYYAVEEVSCMVTGEEECKFVVEVRSNGCG